MGATNTIFAQAAQRYIAKITLAAHMPGNGMGGSTRPAQVITTPAKNPTKGYWKSGSWGIWAAVDETQATACGGFSTQMPQAQQAPTANSPDPNAGIDKFSLEMNGGLACSKMTSGAATAVSNTATFRTVQPVVSQTGSGAGTTNQSPTPATTSDLPHTVPLDVTNHGYLNSDALKNGGITNDQIKKSTRGLSQATAAPAATVTPTACIGPDVIFNDVVNTGDGNGQRAVDSTVNPPVAGQGVALCDPRGYKPSNDDGAGGTPTFLGNAQNTATIPVPSASQSYADNKKWYSGIAANESVTAAAARSGVKLNFQKFWDPITAAQASGGAFCCDALYYGTDGLGRGVASGGNDPSIVDVPKNTEFKPNALQGGAMAQQTVPGGVCTDGDSSTSVKEGLSEAVNLEQEEFLEGQPSTHVWPPLSMP